MSAEQPTPDFWDPSLECGAWVKKPGVIGAAQHTHVCRRPADHIDTDDGTRHELATWRQQHLCGCGHRW